MHSIFAVYKNLEATRLLRLKLSYLDFLGEIWGILGQIRPSVRVCRHQMDKFGPYNIFQYFDFYDFISLL